MRIQATLTKQLVLVALCTIVHCAVVVRTVLVLLGGLSWWATATVFGLGLLCSSLVGYHWYWWPRAV